MKESLIDFYRRFDVWIELVGMVIGSTLAYYQSLPWWLVIALITLRQTFAVAGLLANTRK